MSFSGEVKKELAAVGGLVRHCQLAELAALLSGSGKIYRQSGQMHITLATENERVAMRYEKLLQQTADVTVTVTQAYSVQQKNKVSYLTDISDQKTVRKIFLMLKIISADGHIRENMTLADGLLLQKNCCKRAFLRGAFLAAGSMSNPKKSYHFEIVCGSDRQAQQLKDMINSFGMDAKIVARKKNQVVYVKEGEHIVDLLNIMEAHQALLNLENVRIVKEMRNSVNRQVNCETANISKTVNAAVRQIEDIRFIQAKRGLESLPDNLREIALLRLEFPDAPLKELGTYLNPPVGKSGVNHRLRRISEIAAEMGCEHGR